MIRPVIFSAASLLLGLSEPDPRSTVVSAGTADRTIADTAPDQDEISLVKISPNALSALMRGAFGERLGFRAGWWQINVEADAPMGPSKESLVDHACLSREDLFEHEGRLFHDREECIFDQVEVRGQAFRIAQTCKLANGREFAIKASGMIASDSYEASVDVTDARSSLHAKQHVTGKRLGDCRF